MKKQHKPVNFEDPRGTIRDIMVDSPVDHITLITSSPGVVRGNHYHRHTTQYTYILTGEAEYHSASGQDPVQVERLGPGDFIESPPLEHHAVKALTDMTMLAIARGPRGGEEYESDTYRERTLCE